MNVKIKIRLGLIFLLAIIMLLAGSGSYYINRLATESEDILKDNYNTLQYTKKMIEAMDQPDKVAAQRLFEENLVMQEHNITEAGEKEATKEIRKLFEEFKTSPESEKLKIDMRARILNVQEMNMAAILAKNNVITTKTRSAFAYITILGTLSFLLSFTFVINFPKWITDPIARLTEGIRKIANKDYNTRIEIHTSDEFGEVADAFNNMASELDKWEHSNLSKIMFEKSRIEAIINDMQDAVIGMDEKRRILFVNEVAANLLMLKKQEVIGKYAPDIALKNDLLRNLLNKDESVDLKIYANNKESYFTKNYREVINEKTVIGEVVVLNNVTPFKELDFAKTNFLATISHELKTPISAIKMSVQLLQNIQNGNLNENQKQLVESIMEDTERLLKITGELLNMTQIETGNIQLNIGSVSPHKIITLATEAVNSLAEQKHIKLKVSVPYELPNINADLDKTVWVMVNLLTNAIRFSADAGEIDISAATQENQIQFLVKDYGPGIEDKYAQRVFERYFKVPGSKVGTGLGLAICKEFIEAQGGKIWMESQFGSGASFRFALNVFTEQT
ncbi:MAG: histidine kinase dimerization/phospho-acceptor domain-containing protein [Chitinophagales bacterium]